jgi:hypothetical protein
MKTLVNKNNFAKICLILMTIVLANCGGSKKKSSNSSSGYSYYNCPNSGIYNGQRCQPGSTVYTGNDGSTGYSCAQYTRQYGVQFWLEYYQDQYVCMRVDVAQAYGFSSSL